MNIVGKFVDIDGLKSHVASLQFNGWTPNFVVVHNTSLPSLANYREWRAHPEKHGNWTPEQWGRNLQSYYMGMGWSAGPHLFVCPDGILLFTPLTQHGTHSPKWNSITWGIETVGEFERESFNDGPRTNLIASLGILHSRVGLNPGDYKFGVRGIHFHKEDPITTHKTCPGKFVVKPDLVADVVAYMEASHPGDHDEVPPSVHVADTFAISAYDLTSITGLQTALNSLGASPSLLTDGILGAATKSAVREFQVKNGLVADGIAGPVTRLKIKSLLSKGE